LDGAKERERDRTARGSIFCVVYFEMYVFPPTKRFDTLLHLSIIVSYYLCKYTTLFTSARSAVETNNQPNNRAGRYGTRCD
jgi:hypothetical protein